MVIAFLAANSAIDLQSRTAGEMGKTFERTAMFRGIAERTNCLAAAAVLMFAATGANANLVTNGGFETGDFTGWSLFGDNTLSSVGTEAVLGVPPHSGSYLSSFGPIGTLGGIFQTLATTPGQTYDVEFWLQNLAGGTNYFAFNWDGDSLLEVGLSDASAFGYTRYSFALVASSSSTDLRFTFRNDPTYWQLDDVSVTTGVPEPATLALLGLGLAGLAATRRRKQ